MHLYHLGLTLSSLCSCATAPRAPLNGRDILAESIDDCSDIIVRLVKQHGIPARVRETHLSELKQCLLPLAFLLILSLGFRSGLLLCRLLLLALRFCFSLGLGFRSGLLLCLLFLLALSISSLPNSCSSFRRNQA